MALCALPRARRMFQTAQSDACLGAHGHFQQLDRMTRTEHSYHPVQAPAPVAIRTPYAAPQTTQGTYAAPQPPAFAGLPLTR